MLEQTFTQNRQVKGSTKQEMENKESAIHQLVTSDI